MAVVYAVKTGNWSDTTVWNTGALPTSADDVYANNFTVTINQNITVVSLNTTSTTGVNAGGTFSPNGTYTIVCDTITTGNGFTISSLPASSVITITCNNIKGGVSPFNGSAISLNQSSTQLVINGNLNAYAGQALQINAGTSCTINGNVTSNAGARTLFQLGDCNTTVNGFIQGSTSQVGFECTMNTANTILTATKAITINNGLPAIFNNGGAIATITVKEIEQGNFGQVPIRGFVRISTASGAFYKGITPSGTVRTLTDVADIAGQVPAQTDVRFGVTYQSGAKTGSAYIPAAASVAFGVPVDNTTGTAALTPSAVWNTATSSLTTSGSIGERLKNASTVDTTGDQLAALL